MPDGPFPTRIGLPTTWPPFARGSIRETVPASVFATQTNPPPTVSADRASRRRNRLLHRVRGRIDPRHASRDRTSPPRSTRLRPRSRRARPPAGSRRRCARSTPRRRRPRSRRALPSSCVARDPPLENANSGTATAAAITPLSAERRTARRFHDGRSVTFFARSAGSSVWTCESSDLPGSTVGSATGVVRTDVCGASRSAR